VREKKFVQYDKVKKGREKKDERRSKFISPESEQKGGGMKRERAEEKKKITRQTKWSEAKPACLADLRRIRP